MTCSGEIEWQLLHGNRRIWRNYQTENCFGINSQGRVNHEVHILSGPVLRDTARLSQRYPPIARYGVFGVATWPIGCDTPSPFSERFPLGEHAKWRCDTPPPLKGVSQRYLRDTL